MPLKSMLAAGTLPSPVRRRLYRRRGYRIASDVEFGPGVVIDGEEVSIGAGTRFSSGTVIRGRRIEIGRRVRIGSFCFFDGRDIVIDDDVTVREQVFVGGPMFPDSLLRLGKRVGVFQMSFLNPSRPLLVGNDSSIGGCSYVWTHASWLSVLDGYPAEYEPITIGKGVWLPWHVMVLPGVEIGDNATIAGGSVVNRSIPAGSLAGGVPARVLRESWPQPPTDEERWEQTRSIFAQFVDYLADRGVTVSTEDADEQMALTVRHGEGPRIVRVCRRRADAVPRKDELLVVLDLDAGGKRQSDGPWFDLRRRVKGSSEGPLAAEVEAWLGRFGMRFGPASE